jgi:hypothetical protein
MFVFQCTNPTVSAFSINALPADRRKGQSAGNSFQLRTVLTVQLNSNLMH